MPFNNVLIVSEIQSKCLFTVTPVLVIISLQILAYATTVRLLYQVDEPLASCLTVHAYFIILFDIQSLSLVSGRWVFCRLFLGLFMLAIILILYIYYIFTHWWDRQAWWRHQMETFSALLAIVRGIHQSPVNYPQKAQWGGPLMFSLIYAWTNGWVNKRDVGDWRRHRAHYDVTVME